MHIFLPKRCRWFDPKDAHLSGFKAWFVFINQAFTKTKPWFTKKRAWLISERRALITEIANIKSKRMENWY